MWKTKLDSLLIEDEEFLDAMHNVVEPFLKDNLREGFITNMEGMRLHYAYLLNPNEEASVVVSHGFCEFIGKYHEIMYYLYHMGYSVFFMDHRGHGFSDGRIEDPDCVYVRKYDSYVEDFNLFIEQVVVPQSITKRLFLYAHSMGGGIGTLYLEQYPEVFEKAVLSSPLMAMNTGKFSTRFVHALTTGAMLTGRLKKYIPGQHGYDGVNVFETSSALSRPRYEYVFNMRGAVLEYRTYGASMAWIRASLAATKKLRKNIGMITIPVLLCQAGRDSMVLPWAHEYAAAHSHNIRLERFPESKHEIFNATKEIRRSYYDAVFGYLKE